jgi:hypothetical protein
VDGVGLELASPVDHAVYTREEVGNPQAQYERDQDRQVFELAQRSFILRSKNPSVAS